MGDKSAIEWTDATWNPVRGCSIVSKGCTNCYAMKQAHRSSGGGGAYEGLTKLTKGGPVWTGQVRTVPQLLDQPLRWKKPRRIFVNSMSDLFHESVPFSFVDQVFGVMAITTRHKYQVLTKRPARMLEYFRTRNYDNVFEFPEEISDGSIAARNRTNDRGYDNCGPAWPLVNVWLGVSVEDQAAADERIPLLLQTPAAVRWISAEPLLGPVRVDDLADGAGRVLKPLCGLHWEPCVDRDGKPGLTVKKAKGARIDWLVAGGESGPGARPMHPDWARALRDQCAAAGVPFFFKQWGAWAPIPMLESLSHRGTFIDIEGKPVPLENLPLIAQGGASMVAALQGRTHLSFVGKKLAGRQLDGRTHDEYPA